MKADFTIQAWVASMNMRLKRHAAITGNIANADTPGYRPTQIAFEDKLQGAVKGRSFDKLEEIEGKSFVVDDQLARPDGNSVSLDKQMARLSENTLMFNATAEFIARKFKMIKSVIS